MRPTPSARERAPVKLLAVPGSHPCAAVEAMLNAKRVRYERVDLFPALSRVWLRVTGFSGVTVPALRIDDECVQGSRAIARTLDARWPQPALFPSDPIQRQRVAAMEAWADGPLQTAARRIILWSLLRSREAVSAAVVGARLQFRFPIRLAARVAPPVLWLDAALNNARPPAVRAALASLPGMLDRADEWIVTAERATTPATAADYQIAASVRLLLTVEDLVPLIAHRRVAALARRLIPNLPGHVPTGVLPQAWLP